MRSLLSLAAVLLVLVPAQADEKKFNTLTPTEVADGWILLFDGETPIGWNIKGPSVVEKNYLSLGGKEECVAFTTTEFGESELEFGFYGSTSKAKLILEDLEYPLPKSAKKWGKAKIKLTAKEISIQLKPADGKEENYTAKPPDGRSIRTSLGFFVPSGAKMWFRNIKLKPLALKPIFNGKDLTGWKEIPGKRSKFSVNDKGELNVKDGNGDLQSEGQYDDFILQLDIIANGKHLNSGVFFRCLPGEFWSGYESQIRNQWEGEDRTKPVDFGTGGIYNRQPARKVVPSDNEWFTKTIIAGGNHMAVWINGQQVSDFNDTRPADPSARKGTKLDKGPISIQGHDPTTDLSFRKIRVGELPKREVKKLEKADAEKKEEKKEEKKDEK